MKNLVTEEEITHVAKLMKIDLEDHSTHIKRVQKMLEYFDILDRANVESEEITIQKFQQIFVVRNMFIIS